MKKRILLAIAVLALFASLLSFASCGEHECVFDGSSYAYDDNNHWLKCVAEDSEGCTAISNQEKHAFTEASRKEPTCEANGELTEVCKCGKTRTTVLEAKHKVVENVTLPTCEAEGYTELTCAVEGCEYYEKTNIIAPTHEFEDNVVEPTCTEDGYTEIKCINCGLVQETKDTVPMLGHSFREKVIAPTCVDDGYTVQICGTCDAEGEKSNTVPALDHDYQYKTVEPSCLISGSTKISCSRCDYKSEKDKVAPLGHAYYKEADAREYVHYKVITRPTCDTVGSIKYICTRCSQVSSDELGELPVLGHIETENIVPPTCDQDGVTEIVCIREGCVNSFIGTVEGSTVPALNHIYSMDLGDKEEEGKHFEITLKPTCEETGIKAYICQREGCGRVAEAEKNPEAVIEIPANGHTWAVSVMPWCGNEGVSEEYCEVCDATQNVPDESKEYRHTFPEDGVAVVGKEPSCVAYGSYICSFVNEKGVSCNKEFTAREGDEIGQPTGQHSYDIFIEMIGSTCVKQGYSVYGCSAGECGTTVKMDFEELEAHSIGEISELGFASCENCGKSFVDITSEEIVETDKICMGCGNDPCTCQVLGENTGYIKPSAPMQITANAPLEITGVTLSTGWKDLSIGYGLIILNSQSSSSFVVTVYGEKTEQTFEVSGETVVVDLYKLSSVTKVVITSTEDASVSLYEPF